MRDYRKEYYEQAVFWNYDYLKIPVERERIQEIINVIPSDVQSVLDAGCGNGAFGNVLIDAFPNRFNRVMGLDASKEALKYVKTEKINGTITNLPFEDKSFDLVICLEVLEHLPQADFKKGILEFQRVSKKYIIITVPNSQDLESSLVICPKCHCRFNPNFHMRSFNENSLHNLFRDFKPVEIKEIGPVKYHYVPLLLKFYWAWRKPLPPKTAICPQCGYYSASTGISNSQEMGKTNNFVLTFRGTTHYQHKQELQKAEGRGNSGHILSKILLLAKYLARLFFPSKKRRWLLALYEKTGG